MERTRKLVIVMNILSSSSSSSSDSSDDEDSLLAITYPTKRRKIENYSEIVDSYSDEEFKRNFRLTRKTYEKINDLYEKSAYYPKERTNSRYDLIPASVSILSFLWYAGNKCCIRDVASRFCLAESTFHLIIKNVMDFLLSLAPNIIKFPQTFEEKASLSTEFQNLSGFPDVLGCIDGTYIPIRTPQHKIKSTYVNRHDLPSLTLQVIVDYKKLFLDVFTGVPSKIHDARVFKLSFISKKLPEICGQKWHIIGDSAYPLRRYLLTPYRNYGNLTPQQKNYNKKFCQTRVKVENAFGLLKNRFRQLIKTEFSSVQRTANFIISCCVLHNFCILNADEWTDILEEQNDDNGGTNDETVVEFLSESKGKKEGEEKRDLLSVLLYQ